MKELSSGAPQSIWELMVYSVPPLHLFTDTEQTGAKLSLSFFFFFGFSLAASSFDFSFGKS